MGRVVEKERSCVWWHTLVIRPLEVEYSEVQGYLQLHTKFEASLGYETYPPPTKALSMGYIYYRTYATEQYLGFITRHSRVKAALYLGRVPASSPT